MRTKITNLLGKSLKFDEPLKKHTTFRIGGPAKYFYEVKTLESLEKAVKVASKLSFDFFILGGGSNLLVADRGYEGLVIKNRTNGLKLLTPQEIEAESGVRIEKLINFSLGASLVGLEDFTMIPGTVGGAVYNNIHGSKYLLDKFIKNVTFLTKKGEEKTKPALFFNFSYDYSLFHESQDTVLKVVFKLKPGDRETAKKKKQEIIKKKLNYPKLSAGSIFQNPPNQAVSFLIDKKLGLKGKKIGQAQISPCHAGFIENLGAARARDVMSLIKLIQEEAKKKLGDTFKPEIIFLGFTKKELEDAKVYPAPLA